MTHFLALKLQYIRELELKIEGFANDSYRLRNFIFLYLMYGESIFAPKHTCEDGSEEGTLDDYVEFCRQMSN